MLSISLKLCMSGYMKKILLGEDLRNMPPLNKEGLRDCQVEAIENLEWSLKEARPRALIQMASGSGKTFTAVTEAYRLIKYGGAKRVLVFGRPQQFGKADSSQEFQNYATPDDGRKFYRDI